MNYSDMSFEELALYNWRIVAPGDRAGLTDDRDAITNLRGVSSWCAGAFKSESQAQAWLSEMLRRGFKSDPRFSGWRHCFLLRPSPAELKAEGIDPFAKTPFGPLSSGGVQGQG